MKIYIMALLLSANLLAVTSVTESSNNRGDRWTLEQEWHFMNGCIGDNLVSDGLHISHLPERRQEAFFKRFDQCLCVMKVMMKERSSSELDSVSRVKLLETREKAGRVCGE